MPLQGVTNGCALTQGVASLAQGYALLPLRGVHVDLGLVFFLISHPNGTCARLAQRKRYIVTCYNKVVPHVAFPNSTLATQQHPT